jgi:hypothetical protein
VDSPPKTDLSCFERRPDVIARRLPDRTVLLNGTTGGCFELNGVGSAIWDALDGKRSWAAIALEIASRFALPETTAARDVSAFAEALTRADLIRPAAS